MTAAKSSGSPSRRGGKFHVRRATAADASALTRCRLDLFSELDGDPSPRNASQFERACRRTLKRLLDQGVAAGWLAEVPGERVPVGSSILLTFPRLPTLNDMGTAEGYLKSVYVAPEWRRRGVASALTKAAVRYARSARLARIRLHASAAGRPLYLLAGFRGRNDEMELVFSRRPR